MGKAYAVKCEKCGYQETFYLGYGAGDQSLAEDAFDDLQSGNYGARAQRFARVHEEGAIKCERMLYRCRKCGNLEVRRKMRLLSASKTYSQPYFCSKCSKLMGQVKPSDIKKLTCPVCGQPLSVDKPFHWDIAPKPPRDSTLEQAIAAPYARKWFHVEERLDGLTFLKEYDAHPERYLPILPKCRKIFQSTEQVDPYTVEHNIVWNCGVVQGNRPYFAEVWAMDGITMFTVYISTRGIEDWTAEQVDRMLQKEGLYRYSVKNPCTTEVRPLTAPDGETFFSVNVFVASEDDPPQLTSPLTSRATTPWWSVSPAAWIHSRSTSAWPAPPTETNLLPGDLPFPHGYRRRLAATAVRSQGSDPALRSAA